jgi:3-oxoacyl-[acyl-carrier-protein] synthase III
VNAFITGSASYLPEGIITNEEIAGRLGLDPEQIFKSSGIRRRRWATPGTTTSSLAAEALRLAIDDAALSIDQIDYLLFGTMTPDRLIPGSASAMQSALGMREIPCLDIRAACCNALYALDLARALVRAGNASNVAICLAEVQSPFLDLSAPAGTLSMLFGDAARSQPPPLKSLMSSWPLTVSMLTTSVSAVREPSSELLTRIPLQNMRRTMHRA